MTDARGGSPKGIVEKVRQAHAEGRLTRAVSDTVTPTLRGLAWLLRDPSAKRIRLHCPEYVEPPHDECEREVVRRIFAAFKRMKAVQTTVPEAALYAPSSLWQQQLDEAYAPLAAGLRDDDVDTFHFFLANFGTWARYHGIEYSTFIRKNMATALTRKYLRNDVFDRQLKVWRWMYNDRRPLTALTYPTHGNQAGAYVDDVFIGVNSFFKEVYGSILAGILRDRARPIVAELGAGYGKLAYFTLRERSSFAFVDFDLPETLCVAAYYLIKSWPGRKALLYGEDEYLPDRHDEYDLVFMPCWEISKVGSRSVDLFVNHASLGEMTRDAVLNYVRYIGESTQYFFHMNHDVYPNHYSATERGLLGSEYALPSDTFRQLFRYPDIGHLLYSGGIDFKNDIFVYLYERIAGLR